MTEQDLINLGFEKQFPYDEVSGHEGDWHYYSLDICRGFSLISCSSDEKTLVAGHYRWYVEVFETPEINFVEKKDLEEFINIIKRNTK